VQAVSQTMKAALRMEYMNESISMLPAFCWIQIVCMTKDLAICPHFYQIWKSKPIYRYLDNQDTQK